MSLFAQNKEFFNTVRHCPRSHALRLPAPRLCRSRSSRGFPAPSCAGRLTRPVTAVAQACPALGDPMDCSTQASPAITSSGSLLGLVGDAIQPSRPLPSPLLLPPVPPSIRGSSRESGLRMRWPQYRSLSICRAQECTVVG